MENKSIEHVFQADMLQQLVRNGWLLGKSENYNRTLALYPEDLLGFVQETQYSQWQKFCNCLAKWWVETHPTQRAHHRPR